MSTNYRSFLRHLPVKSDLIRHFLTARDLDPGIEFDWAAEEHIVARSLANFIENHSSNDARQQVIVDLERAAKLANTNGTRQMLTVCGKMDAIVAAFSNMETPEERALWLFQHHPDKFQEAMAARFFDGSAARSVRHNLKIQRTVDRSDSAIKAMEHVISGFFKKKEGCGQVCIVEFIDRHIEGTVQMTVYVQDLPSHRAEFDESGLLKRRRSHPAKEVALNFNEATGIADTVIKGGANYHNELAAAFAEHILHCKVAPERIARQTYRISNLKSGVAIADPANHGISRIRLRSITLWDPANGMRMAYELKGRDNLASINDVLAKTFPHENPLKGNFTVIGAEIAVHFYPAGTEKRGEMLSLEFGSKGWSNFHKLEEQHRLLVEKLLPELGLIEVPHATVPPNPDGTPPASNDDFAAVAA